jgi:VanZ family protein
LSSPGGAVSGALMKRETIRRGARWAFWGCVAGSYTFAIMPVTREIGTSNDKVNHIIAFATMAFLGRLGWSRTRARWIAVGLVAFGAFIEISQGTSIVHRDASWADLAADTVATIAGLILGKLALRIIRRRWPN